MADTIGIYARVSTDDQKTNTSIPLQLEEGKKFCDYNNFSSREYVDTYSGASITREGWIQLFKDIEEGEIDAVWVKAADRFSRNTIDGLTALQVIRAKKIRFYIGSTEQDIFTPEFEIMISMQFAFAQYERSKILKRTMDGRIATVDAGGKKKQMIFGYDNFYTQEGKRLLVINEEEAKTIRYIFKLYKEENLSFKAIAKRLNSEGYKTKNSGKKVVDRFTKKETIQNALWSQTHISYIMKRPEYCGLTTNWDKSKMIEAKYFPPIIDRKMWLDIQPKITALSMTRNRGGVRKSEHVLSGMIRCENCNAQYYYRGFRNNKYYFHKSDSKKQGSCKNLPKYIRADEIERAVAAVYLALMHRGTRMSALFADYKNKVASGSAKLESDLGRLRARMLEVEKRIEALLNAIEERTVRNETAKGRMEALETELDRLKKEVEAKEKEAAVEGQEYESALSAYKQAIVSEWKESGGSRRREIYYQTFTSVSMKEALFSISLRVGGTIRFHWDEVKDLTDESRLTLVEKSGKDKVYGVKLDTRKKA